MMDETSDDSKQAGAGVSHWQLAAAAILVGSLVGAAWFAINRPAEQRAVAAAAAAGVVTEAPLAPARAGDIAQIMTVDAPAETASPQPGEGEMLVCGQVLPRAALEEDRLAQTLRDADAADAVLQFAAQRLNDDDHARAVGLVLRLQSDALFGESGHAACRSHDCWKQAGRLHAQRVAPLVTELATLAATSTDARVMALARDQCGFLSANDSAPPPHCQALSARRLVALERDNAAAWLALAAEEPAAIDEAMYQAALAPRWDDHSASARRFIERVDAKGGLRSMLLVTSLLHTQAAQSIAGTQLVLQRCTAAAVATDANRRQQCEQMAQGLRTRSTSLMGLATAAALAKSLGHEDAQDRHDDARLLAHVLQTRERDPTIQEADASECAHGLPRELLLRSAREGEVPALRALLQASGDSMAQWRESLAAADAAEAASKKLASAGAGSTPR